MTATATTAPPDVISQAMSTDETQQQQTRSQQKCQQQQQPDPLSVSMPDTPSCCTRAQTSHPDDQQPGCTAPKRFQSMS